MLKTSRRGKHALPTKTYKAARTLRAEQAIPERWDWRERVGTDRAALLTPVTDQGVCGSCYAVAVVDAFASRLSIATGGANRVVLSPQEMINCGRGFVSTHLEGLPADSVVGSRGIETADDYELDGCDGGLLVGAANYLVVHGAPTLTDAPYLSFNGFDSQQCGASADVGRYYASEANAVVRGEDFTKPDVTSNAEDIESMQIAIMTNGPVVVGIDVYDDFMVYPALGQVYRRNSTMTLDGVTYRVDYDGGHAIQVVGWDRIADETGTLVDVWVCKNQWGTAWGLDGYIYVRRGTNEIGIETDVCENTPDLTRAPFRRSRSASSSSPVHACATCMTETTGGGTSASASASQQAKVTTAVEAEMTKTTKGLGHRNRTLLIGAVTAAAVIIGLVVLLVVQNKRSVRKMPLAPGRGK